MNQNDLEKTAVEIFEDQGFEVKELESIYRAVKGEQEKIFQVFSSEVYSEEEIISELDDASIVFVDSELSDIKEKMKNQVSVLEEQNEEDVDTPSYEMIGDIALINQLPEMSEKEAVEAIRHYEPSVKTVLLKEEGLSGEFRVGDYRKIYGEETETVHKEFGCRFRVDPTKVYYSERFSTERDRVVSQIKDGEKVLVMFAGVGPYAVMAARNANPEKVVAVEKNPEAADYMRENVELNDVGETVEVHEGDVENVLPELESRFDRVVMPLPGSAEDYLALARSKTEPGSVIHLYRFEEDEKPEFEDMEILSRTVCGEKSPSESRVCYDIRVTNNNLTFKDG